MSDIGESESAIRIGDDSIHEVHAPTYVYDVSLRGYYSETEEMCVRWPSSAEWHELEFIHDEDDLDEDSVVDMDVIDIETGECFDTYTVRITRRRWFAIGDEVTADESRAEMFDTAYFETVLAEHRIPPENVLEFEHCSVTECRRLYRDE